MTAYSAWQWGGYFMGNLDIIGIYDCSDKVFLSVTNKYFMHSHAWCRHNTQTSVLFSVGYDELVTQTRSTSLASYGPLPEWHAYIYIYIDDGNISMFRPIQLRHT